MSLIEVFLIGVGLSMDAFAVSVGKGLSMRRVDIGMALKLAVAFGLFQALMPLAGWALSSTFASAVQTVSGWIAFILLLGVGGKMLWDGIHDDGEGEGEAVAHVGWAELLLLAVATSIDAFAVGITFALLEVPPFPAVAIIGAITFGLSFVGVALGSKVGAGIGKPAAIAGGIILIGIGLKVLLFP